MERIIAYIDGFNFYFGLKSKRWKKYYWLNQKLLIENLLYDNQKLILTKYFTARISMPPDKVKRQSVYLEALETLPDFQIYYGHYLIDYIKCFNCGNLIFKPSEKMTDVNIAIELVKDAYNDNFDKAFLISADSDLVGPIKTIKDLFPKKKIVVIFPPGRSSKQLMKISSAYFTIGHRKLAISQFPNEVVKSDGFTLCKPNIWK